MRVADERGRRPVRMTLLVVALSTLAVAASGQDQAPAKAPEAESVPVSARIVKWIESQRDKLDQLSERRARNGLFPRLGVVTAGSGLAAGGGIRDERIDGGPVGLLTSAIFSYRRYEEYELQFGLLEHQRDAMGLATADTTAASMFREAEGDGANVSVYADLRYRHYPQQPYYGSGPNSSSTDRAPDFLLFGASYDAVVQYQPARRFGVAGRVGFLDLGLGPGRNDEHPNVETVFSPEAAPGLSRQPQFLTLAAGAVLDAREPRGDPHSGVFLGATVWRFDARGTSAFDFTRVIVDGRSYFTPFQERGVLALRALLSFDRTDAGARVPFYLQQTLGGGETLRGFSNYRFRDLAGACVSAEYRWQMIEYVDVGPFVDVGTVGAGLSKLSARDVTATFGLRAGLRYGSRALFHFDWGKSRDGQTITAGTGVLF